MQPKLHRSGCQYAPACDQDRIELTSSLGPTSDIGSVEPVRLACEGCETW